jgi:hypothetical protein
VLAYARVHGPAVRAAVTGLDKTMLDAMAEPGAAETGPTAMRQVMAFGEMTDVLLAQPATESTPCRSTRWR